METSKILSTDWRFFDGNGIGMESPEYPEDIWEKISLPHTWNAFDAQEGKGKFVAFVLPQFGGYRRTIAWYRHSEIIPENLRSKALFLRFEGVCSIADVYFNGQHLGTHKGAFGAFCMEITPFVKFGQKNLIAVRVDNTRKKDVPPLSGDFPLFGGIYRPVHLVIKNPVCITPMDYASQGIYLKQTEVSEKRALVYVIVKIGRFQTEKFQDSGKYHLITNVTDHTGKPVFSNSQPFELSDATELTLIDKILIESPHLWNGLVDPYLYSVKCEIKSGDIVLDSVIQPLGLRYFSVDAKLGFLLNGKPYFVHGVCKHQDKKDKGWAVSPADIEEDVALMKVLGVRGVRLAHYQHPELTYALCDTHGILVWAEISLVNKVTFDASFFENAKTQLLEMIWQNYNHPSIFCWGLCNEIGLFQLRDPSPVIRKLHDIAKQEDPTRLTTFAAIAAAIFRKRLNRCTDLLGLNAYPGWYYGFPADMKKFIDRMNESGGGRGLCLSEYGAGGGITQHEQHPMKPKAGGPWHPEEWQCLVHEETYRIMRDHPGVWGSFLWNMFDFAVPFRNEGDTHGTNDKGLVTYDRRTKKDVFFFYQANWSPVPMIYITSRRHQKRTEAVTPVKIYSNASQVELKINGISLGNMEHRGFGIFIQENVHLSPGSNKIEAIAHKDNQTLTDSCTWEV
jgi:beta-galactosidase